MIPSHAIVLAAVLVAGCSGRPNGEPVQTVVQDSTVNSVGVKADTSTIVVLPFDTSSYWLFEDSACRNVELSLRDLDTIETLVQQCIAEYMDARSTPIVEKTDSIRRDLHRIGREGYVLQCIAVINSHGEKEVWVNALCNHSWPTENAWKERIQLVQDGGGCFYQLKVNLSKANYYDLRVNGIA